MSQQLKIYMLGRFEVSRGNEILTEDRKKTSKQWKLLQYLLTFAEREISREELIMELGLNNNDDPQAALSALVYRLRSTLSFGKKESNYIKTIGSAYKFNQEADYWLDIEEFARACKKSRDLITENVVEAKDTFAEALSLYKGDFLQESPSAEWIWTTRNKYRDMLLRTLFALDDFLRQKGMYDVLWNYYQKVQALVPFNEDLLIRSIKLLISANKIGKARQQYQEVVEIYDNRDYVLPEELKEIEHRLDARRDEELEELLQELQVEKENEGAFVCNTDEFIQLYELEKKRTERDVPGRCLVHFQLQGEKQGDKLHEVSGNLYQLLSNHLRSGDIFCRWNHKQFVALLVNVTCEEATEVARRIKNSFQAKYGLPEGIELKCKECKSL
ncbi:MAG: BTAD domain-containing putative transcriptional regulator [Bacillota bacterium]